jgi:hypothetical protein
MRRSKYRRASRNANWFSGKRRIIAVAATLVAFGGIVTVTQVSNASTTRTQKKALSACDNIATPPKSKLSTKTRRGDYTTNNGTVTQHPDDGAGATVTATELRNRCRQWVMQNVGNNQGGKGGTQTTAPTVAPTTAATTAPAADPSASGDVSADPSASGDVSADPSASSAPTEATTAPTEATTAPTEATTAAPAPSGSAGTTPPPGAGLGVLTNSCSTSQLAPHTGFQDGNRCVSTEFGEVGSEANNPTLLITEAPRSVAANTPFTLKISTRNLIRDRFLAAGKGGYYVESSVLQNGLVRGHFHTACRMLANTSEAPAPDPVPAFFVATEDSKGNATPDTVTIQVPGLPTAGTAQCASWAGDGSHRIPMMQRANQIPSFDSVRIRVR